MMLDDRKIRVRWIKEVMNMLKKICLTHIKKRVIQEKAVRPMRAAFALGRSKTCSNHHFQHTLDVINLSSGADQLLQIKLVYIIIRPKQNQETGPRTKTDFSAGKVMKIVFWDSRGAILIDYLQKEKDIT